MKRPEDTLILIFSLALLLVIWGIWLHSASMDRTWDDLSLAVEKSK